MSNKSNFNSRAYFRLGQSGSIFGISLIEQYEKYPNIRVLSSDMSRPAGLDRFISLFPKSFYNVGIAEQNLIGVASGLSSEGYLPIVVAQACFLSMRSFEQVRQYFGYMNNRAILIGISSGFALTFFGNTHYSFEDLTLMKSIPGMTVLSPADSGEAIKCFEAATEINGPVYIRLTGGLMNPVVYKEDYSFEVGKVIELQKNGKSDIALFSTGSMVHQAVRTADLLSSKGYMADVINIHTIKPFDSSIIDKFRDYKLLVSIEEHNTIGGLGSIIADSLSEKPSNSCLLKLGVKDCFSIPGDYDYLLACNRLTPELLSEDIISKYSDLVH